MISDNDVRVEVLERIAVDLAEATRAQCGMCVEANAGPTARVKPVRIDSRDGPVHLAIDDINYGCELTSREAAALIAYDALKESKS